VKRSVLISLALHLALFLVLGWKARPRTAASPEDRWVQLVASQPPVPHVGKKAAAVAADTSQAGMGSSLGNPGRPTVVALGELVSLGNEAPQYPERARRMGWEGEVLLHLRIGEAGNVEEVSVSRSSGFDLLDESASQSARGWHWKAGRRAALLVPIVYELRR
jgi:TonB family protein